MQQQFEFLLTKVMTLDATDVHFTHKEKQLYVTFRGLKGIEAIQSSAFNTALFNYLKYMSNLDLGNMTLPQSGNFTYLFQNIELYFRFSLITTAHMETGVLRILNNHKILSIEKLTSNLNHLHSFYHWTSKRTGLIILSGPTGSGKSTTLHALLEEIARKEQLKIFTLEDPIEIKTNSYVQLQINERNNFSYEEGIKQLLRHDPDVIMIGEVRDESTAKMLFRCALSGHLVFTTMHAKSASEAIKRLQEFGISKEDMHQTLSAISAQRLFQKKGRKERICIYEILEKEELSFFLQKGTQMDTHKTMVDEILHAIQEEQIYHEEASLDF